MNTTIFKGQVAQMKVELRAAEKGVTLSKPTLDARYDYILDDVGLQRVQVKYTDGSEKIGAVRVRLTKDLRSGKKRIYTREEVDVLLVYIPKLDKILRFEADEFWDKTAFWINIGKRTKSGERSRMRYWRDYVW